MIKFFHLKSKKCIFAVDKLMLMKKIYFLLFFLFLGYMGFAQVEQEPSVITVHEQKNYPQHEVNWNILNTLVMASAEVGYEFFFNYDQSVGAKILINDRYNYKPEKSGKKFNTNSIRVNYTYYLGSDYAGSEFYVQPFAKYRFGDYKKGSGNERVKVDMNGFIVGIGAGYIWNFSDSFVVGPFANIGRNFGKEAKDEFSAFDFNAGINIGYRF